MSDSPYEEVRHRLIELAQDPGCTPFVIGYLSSGMRTSDLADLVQKALEFKEKFPVIDGRYDRLAVQLERWRSE